MGRKLERKKERGRGVGRREEKGEVWRGFFLLYKSFPIMKNVSGEG